MKKSEALPLLDAVAEVVKQYVDEKIAEVPAGEAGPIGMPGPPGRDADPEVVRSMVEAAVAALPPAKDGERGVDGKDGEPGAPGERGEKGAPGPGPDADLVRAAVAEALPPLLEGVKGDSGEPGPQGEPGEQGALGYPGPKGDPGEPGPRGEDGKSITVEDLQPMIETFCAKWALDFERRAADVLQRAAERIPVPKDGIDGMSIEDMAVEHDGEGNVTIRFSRGEVKREWAFRLPCFRDRGAYSDEVKDYLRGDGVSSGGCLWLAQRDAPEGRPGTVEGQWRLAVKKGRDGRDLTPGVKGEPPSPVRLK